MNWGFWAWLWLNCELRIANCELRIANCELRIANCELRIIVMAVLIMSRGMTFFSKNFFNLLF
ncbi:hypothetical protein E6P74_00815 [Moraxella lacunata]|nr:hypothetical protein [Moraxella lacunata]